MSMSTSSNQSSSSSTPQVTETPENGLIDQIGETAAGLAGQMESWANGVFAQTSAVTNEAVGNFMQASQQMMGLAGNMTNQYNTEFAPENTDLINDANEYASTSRMQTDMGQAGATQAQAGDQAIKNSEANLVSMGIDPSSGRYAALDKAAAVQNAANVAGAENTQRNADTATGQALRSEAVQVGSQLPSAITNATNASTQANAAAANASDANANTGANLQSLADKYLQTAMGIKLPLQGQKSSSESTGNSNSSSPSKSSGSGSGGGGAGGGGNGTPSGGGFNPGMGPNTAAMGNDGGSGRGGSQPGSEIMHIPGGPQGPDPEQPMGTPTDMANSYLQDMYGEGGALSSTDFGQWGGGEFGDQSEGGWPGTGEGDPAAGTGSMGIGDPSEVGGWDQSGAGGSTPFDDGEFGQTFGGDGGDSWTGSGDASQDIYGMGSGLYNSQSQSGGNSPTDSSNTDWGQGASDPYGDNASDYNDDQSDGSGGGGDYSSYQDQGSDYNDEDDSGGDYAGGGSFNGGLPRPAAPPMQARRPQPQATTGGPVRPSMSPSGGARTDDVNAHLNADEFVLPKDVVKWKGEEFMHKLIADSRMKRQKMAAALGTGGKPSQGPKPAGPPRFNSRPMGQ